MANPTRFTDADKQKYDRDGFVIIRNMIPPAECDHFVEHMLALHAGQETMSGFPARAADDFTRTHNQHLWDKAAMNLLLYPALEEPLEACMGAPAQGVQTMYFYKGSEQRRHQDQYYLPGCMSAWLPLEDVGPANGTIWVQPGSHKGKLISQGMLRDKDGNPLGLFGAHYDDAVDAMFRENGLPEVPVEARKGDAVFFHGVLIHRGGPIGKPGSFRHVMANHYIAKNFSDWPHADWPRFNWDGTSELRARQLA